MTPSKVLGKKPWRASQVEGNLTLKAFQKVRKGKLGNLRKNAPLEFKHLES